jgi:hypothetical protein
MDALRTGAQLAETMSMAIPPPQGPLVMVALQIFEQFLPSPSEADPSKELMKAIVALPAEIGNDARLSKAKNILGALKDGLAIVSKDWQDAKGQDYEANTIDTCRDKFKTQMSIASDEQQSLKDLLDVAIDDGVSGYQAGRAAISAYIDLLLGYIVAKKVYVELAGAKIGVLARERRLGRSVKEIDLSNARKQVRTDFNDLINTVNLYSDKNHRQSLDGLIQRLREKRGLLATVETDGYNHPGILWGAYLEKHCINDKALDPAKVWEIEDTYTVTVKPPGGRVYEFQCYKDVANSKLDQEYRPKILQDFDADVTPDVNKIFSNLQGQITQVSSIQPQDPASGPSAEWIDLGRPGYWKVPAGTAVAWGIAFCNGSLNSRILWSSWSTSPGGNKAPKLTLPIDGAAHPLAQSRTIYRLTHSGGEIPPQLPPMDAAPNDALTVLLVPDNTTQLIFDSEIDSDLGLPPLPQGPPITKAPSAPPDAGRCYSFTYYDKANPEKESPIAASPETSWLILKAGDALSIFNVGAPMPRVYSRGRTDKSPINAVGSITQAGDGQTWIWKAP